MRSKNEVSCTQRSLHSCGADYFYMGNKSIDTSGSDRLEPLFNSVGQAVRHGALIHTHRFAEFTRNQAVVIGRLRLLDSPPHPVEAPTGDRGVATGIIEVGEDGRVTLTSPDCLLTRAGRCACSSVGTWDQAVGMTRHGPLTLLDLSWSGQSEPSHALKEHRWSARCLVGGRCVTKDVRVHRIQSVGLGLEGWTSRGESGSVHFSAIGLRVRIDLVPPRDGTSGKPVTITFQGATFRGTPMTLRRLPDIVRGVECSLSLLSGAAVSLSDIHCVFEKATEHVPVPILGGNRVGYNIVGQGHTRARPIITKSGSVVRFNNAASVKDGLADHYMRSWLTALALGNQRAPHDPRALFESVVEAFEGAAEASSMEVSCPPTATALKIRELRELARRLAVTTEDRAALDAVLKGLKEPRAAVNFKTRLRTAMELIDFAPTVRRLSSEHAQWTTVDQEVWVERITQARNNWAHRGSPYLNADRTSLTQQDLLALAMMFLCILHLWLMSESQTLALCPREQVDDWVWRMMMNRVLSSDS